MRIQQIFAAENFRDPNKIEWARQEAEYILKVMEADPNVTLAERLDQQVAPDSLQRFFRRHERNDKACRVLQYLLAFLERVPTQDDLAREPVNPADQFRDFIAYQADLLLEEDVQTAVFSEANHRDLPRAGSVWDFQERLLATNRTLKNMLAKSEGNVSLAISNQCRVLEKLSEFWFEVRRQDLRRTRRSDIFTFLLAQLVRSRCWQTGAS